MTGKIYRLDPAIAEECERIRQRIAQTRNIEISKTQASRILAWKARGSSKMLTDAELIRILGGKNGVSR